MQTQEKKIDRLKIFLLDPAVVSDKDLGAQVSLRGSSPVVSLDKTKLHEAPATFTFTMRPGL